LSVLVGGLFESLPLALAELDREQCCVRVNRHLSDLLDVPADALIGCHAAEFPAPLANYLSPLIEQARHIGAPVQDLELYDRFPGRPGADTHVVIRVHALHDADGAVAGMILLLTDVTEQRETDSALKENKVFSQRVLDSLSSFVCVLEPDGTLISANQPPLRIAGLSLDDVRGRKLWDCFWWNVDAEVQERIREAVTSAAAGQASRFDSAHRMGRERFITVDFMLVPLRDEAGNITHLIASSIDISDRKAGEEALVLSEQRFRQVVESAPDGMAMVGLDSRMVLVNAAMETLFGYRRDEMLGQSVEMLMPDRYRSAHGALFSGYMRRPEARDMAGRRELYARRKDGSEFPVEIGLNPISTSGETTVLATIQDVTTRKAYRELIENALAEKTTLLNEIHHRVKNNLQVISSLLNLQSRTAGPEVAAALTESQRRVKSMALIHQLLYEHSDYSRVDLAEYLSRMCRLLSESFMETRHRVTVNFQAIDGALTLDLQRAVPCGLLVNELVTNAIKHAFPDGRHGSIQVVIERSDPKNYRVSVSDDGVGVPRELELGRTNTLGFQLIPLLAEQTGGKLQLLRGEGTRYELVLTETEQNN
jgi:PAS domain S-box-containing protein